MPAQHPWRSDACRLDHRTVRVRLLAESPLTFAEVFELLEDSPAFRSFFTTSIREAGYDSYFWEVLPVTKSTINHAFEFVVVDGGSLEFLRPDPGPFSEHFALWGNASVIDFPNLGGDTLLVVPAPVASDFSCYTHLGAFLRGAPASQVDAFWQTVGRGIRRRLSASPIWLSTAGMGVSWLHLRLDSRPKYYRHRPYTAAP